MNPKLADVTLSRIVVAFSSVSVDAPGASWYDVESGAPVHGV
jgi:hypothetical protein